MDVTEKISLWGRAHAAAQEAARSLTRQGAQGAQARQEAQALRERADRLHREIYRELGGGPRRA